MENSWSGRETTSLFRPKIYVPQDDYKYVALQMTVVDPDVGQEVVLVIKDSHPMSMRYFKTRGLWLHLKAGLWETTQGAVIYLAWLLPSARYRTSPVLYGDVANPCDPQVIPMLDIAGDQSHLHVFLFGKDNQFIRAVEVPNIFRLGELAEAAREAAEEAPVTDFQEASNEFYEEFDPRDLLDLRVA
jgi:hypothetical protein